MNQITVDRKSLEREIAICKKIIAGGNRHLAIIENVVLLFLPGESLVIQATNLEHAYLGVMGKPINRKYRFSQSFPKVLVSLNRFEKVVKAIPKKKTEISLEITWDGEGLKVNGSTTIVAGMRYADYPELPKIPWGISHNPLCYEKIDQVNSIPDGGDKRAHLMSLYVNAQAGHLVSTDGSRLYVADIPVSKLAPFMIPKKTAAILCTAQLKSNIGAVRVDRKGVFGFVETGNGFVSFRVPDGQFPDYQAIFPGRDPVAVIATDDKQNMIDVMLEAAGILNENYKGVIINSDIEKLVVTATNPDAGEFQRDISKEFDFLSTEPVEMAFNQAFIIDACKQMSGKGLNFSIYGADSPGVIDDQAGFRAVLMPMRV